jgi:hypothetical protein
MARYIDAEKINYHKQSVCGGHGLNYEYTVALKHEVDAIPTADVVEVCRCKDCAYAGKDIMHDDMYGCSFYRDMRKGDDFCNYGKRVKH